MGFFDSLKKIFNGGKKETDQPKQPEPQPKAQPEPAPAAAGPVTNEYGDIIISMAQFNQLLQRYGQYPSAINNFRFASANGFINGVNMINNIITVNTNNGVHYYDPRFCKALFIEGAQYYVVIDENHLRSQGVDPNCNAQFIGWGINSSPNNGNNGSMNGNQISNGYVSNIGNGNVYIAGDAGGSVGDGIDEEFDMTGVTGVSVRTSSADVNLIPSGGDFATVVSNGFVEAEVKGNVLSIDASNCGSSVEIALPEEANLNLMISSSSGDVDVEDITFKNVKISASSGDINFDGSAINLDVNSSSGDLTISHNYIADGGANLNTSSGDITYSITGVKTLNLYCSCEAENDFSPQSRGFVANVSIGTSSGYVTID